MATRTITKRTSELEVGDIVLTHGMRVLIDEAPTSHDHTDRDVRSTRGLVLNIDEVKAAGLVPLSWLYSDASGNRAEEPRWAVQGNDLARWSVEAPADFVITQAYGPRAGECAEAAITTARMTGSRGARYSIGGDAEPESFASVGRRTKALEELTIRELNLKAIGLRNSRDRFSFGSPHADEAVQELARVERELHRRRQLQSDLYQAELELENMMAHPYAVACGEADAVLDRIDALKRELGVEA